MTRSASRPARARPAGPRQDPPIAAELPVARIAVAVPLAHLDRPFDYLVPADADADAVPGVRVRVRFAGRLVDGFLLERLSESEHSSRLGVIDRVISPEPVLVPEIATLARAVADRYAGTMADVLRLAVPPRHARAESTIGTAPARGPTRAGSGIEPSGSGEEYASWAGYRAGAAFLSAVREGRSARAVWQARPGEDWPLRLAEAAAAAAQVGRGALLIAPDARDLDRLDAALTTTLGPGRHLVLSADLGPAERYRRFLAVRRGLVRVVAGTRGAAFAPLVDPGLIAVWDDGDDLLAEPRAPYPHAREVLILRSAAAGCPLLIGGFARTAEAQLLLDSGWAHAVSAGRSEVRAAAARIEAAGDEFATGADSAAARARLSPAAFAAARGALEAGAPVLVQVPRRGYLPGLACQECRRPARCRRCRGPLAMRGNAARPSCRWCGTVEAQFVCPACGGTRLRASVTGAARTAEEIGRAFPAVPAGHLVRPNPCGRGYRPSRRSWSPRPAPNRSPTADMAPPCSSTAPRCWAVPTCGPRRRPCGAGWPPRPWSAGRRRAAAWWWARTRRLSTVQALIRWDPAGHAAAELAARTELGFPPAVAMAALEGTEEVVGAAVADLELPPSAQVLGPVPMEGAAASDGPVRGIAARGAGAGTDLACRSEGAGRGPANARRGTFRPEGRGWTAHRRGPGRMGLIGHADHGPDARPSRDGGRRWLA